MRKLAFAASGLTIGMLGFPLGSAGAAGCTEQLAQDFLAAWSHNDMPNLMAVYSDDIDFTDKTVNANMHGKKQLQDFAQGWFKAMPDMNFTTVSVITAGDKGTVEWVAHGTQKGDLPGMPATNKAVNVPGVSVLGCKDGKISYEVDYWDYATLMRQLGYLSNPSQ
jgi:steroid delta-isomerase-like uncharacterized protein